MEVKPIWSEEAATPDISRDGKFMTWSGTWWRRQRDHQIHLSLPTHHRKLLKADDLVQLEEHNPAKLKSRVLIVERRYAVFVGLAWMLAGQAILGAKMKRQGPQVGAPAIYSDLFPPKRWDELTIPNIPGVEKDLGTYGTKVHSRTWTQHLRCTICSEIPSLGMRMCQRGEGRYCAFEYHGTQIVASIVLMGVGLLLAIYATCGPYNCQSIC
eukprot:symbB.v1.2.036969.t1/scaffold5344.1/size28264/3